MSTWTSGCLFYLPGWWENTQDNAWGGPSTFILSFWGIPKWLRQVPPCPAAPRGGRASAEPHALHQGKKEPHWYQYCTTWTVVASHFSVFHQQMGPDELHFMWDDSTLPWTYLIWFVLSLTLIQPTGSGTWWRLIYVGSDVLRLQSLAYRLVHKKLSPLKLSFYLIRHKLAIEESFIIWQCASYCASNHSGGTKAQMTKEYRRDCGHVAVCAVNLMS